MTKLSNTDKMFTLDGTVYTMTKTGYCYKTTGRKDKKGNDVNMRIARKVFDDRYEEYLNQEADLSKFEKKEEPKKVRKPRRSKDIAFEHEESGLTLTAKQVDFMKHLPDTCFWENGLDSALWCDVLADEIGGQFAGKPMTVGAMISILREKSVVSVGREDSRQGKPKFMVLTDLGKQIAQTLGLS